MTFRSRLRIVAVAALTAALGATLVAPADAHGRHGRHGALPDSISLPTGWQPEGIAIDARHGVAYLGSLANGDIYAANLKTGKGKVIVPGPGTPSVGLKVSRHTLYVAGGPSGTARVIDLKTGQSTSYQLTTGPAFINDVVLTPKAAWFTNSQLPELYRVTRGRHPEVSTLPLTGDWVQQAGFNANGIARTPNGRALLVVQTATGLLFRVDPTTGVAKIVDLGGYALTNGDGLLVRGRTLYVVQNQDNKIAVFRLNAAGTTGALVDTLTNPALDVPTTVAAYRGGLYLPNARFGIADPTSASYAVIRVPLEK